jgi:tripartite-type tricarboxylate transporter receptor subunit TctC
LKGLAVTGAAPTALAPGLQTVAASGVPGYESTAVRGLFAPAKVPTSIVQRLNQEFVRAINRTDVRDKFFTSGTDAYPSTPEDFAAKVKADVSKWAKVIKDAGIHLD